MKKINLIKMETNWNDPQYLKDIFQFKSNRRVTLLSSLNNFFELDKPTLKSISDSFECLHFSVTTVDDILDNETYRNGKLCYNVRHGIDKSVIASFSTFIKFLENTSSLKALDNDVITYIQQMLISEEADCGLRERPTNISHYNWYYKICSTKTSNEILSIIQILHNLIPSDNILEIKEFYFELGRLAQMVNDRRDLITTTPLKRFSKRDKIKLTYSLPLSIYLDEIDSSIENKIGEFISQENFLTIQKSFLSEYIKKRVDIKIEEQSENLKALFHKNIFLQKEETLNLFYQIINNIFYKNTGHEILSK